MTLKKISLPVLALIIAGFWGLPAGSKSEIP